MDGRESEWSDREAAEHCSDELEDEGGEFVGTMLGFIGIVFFLSVAVIAVLIGAAMSVFAAF